MVGIGANNRNRAQTITTQRQQAVILEQESQRLEEYEKQKGTFQEIIRIAQEKLGLIQPDSVIIQPE
jgi:hypothetical protein